MGTMQWSDTLQNVLLLGGGAVVLKVLEYLNDLARGVLKRRRTELDRLAQELAIVLAENTKQTLLKNKAIESYWVLRAMMIKSGHWEPDDLPDEPNE